MKETSGSLTATTVVVDANVARAGISIANNSDTVMTYRPLGTATAALGIAIPANTTLTIRGEDARGLIQGAGSVFCAGTSKPYYILEW